MAQAVPRETTAHLSDPARHWITAIAAVIGVVAAAVGTWLAYGPSDATVSPMTEPPWNATASAAGASSSRRASSATPRSSSTCPTRPSSSAASCPRRAWPR